MAKPVVLDASAVLAVLYDEPGAERIVSLLPGSLLSTVSLAEVHGRLLMDGRAPNPTWNRVLSMGFEVVFFSDEQARLAGELGTIRPALSLGERACLALGIERRAVVYTTNPAWKHVQGTGLDVVVMG